MSMRPRDGRRVPRFEPEGLPEMEASASTVTREGLEAVLEEYLGDPVFAKRFADCMDIIRVKNADYSQGEHRGDRVAAFRRIARDLDVPVRKVWGVFFQKHWGAIVKYMKDGFVESEPLDGRINDAINYLVLLGVIVGETESQ